MNRDVLKVYAPAVLLVAAGFLIAYQFVGPPPPTEFTIAAGRADGGYDQAAQAYRAVLAETGIDLAVLETAGSVENLELLRAGAAQAALVQGGIGDPDESPGLRALGSVYYEPVWLFHREDAPTEDLRDLRGRRVAVGGVGSGVRAVADQLLADNGIAAETVDMGGADAAEALAAGAIDAAFFVSAVESPLVRELLAADGIELLSFRRADAYTSRRRFFSHLTLPEGIVDLEANLPARDIELIAPTATVVVAEDLHPALRELMMQVLAEVHEPGGLVETPGAFPTPNHVDFPLADEAARYFKSGPPLFQRYLPFWPANTIQRLWVLLIPVLTLLFPIFKIAPPLYQFTVSRKINKQYRALLNLETALRDGTVENEAARGKLAEIETAVAKTKVPLGYSNQLYVLKEHVQLVKGLLG